jgi:hypothetical protein
MKFKILAILAFLMTTGMIGLLSSSCENPPAGPSPTATPTVCVPAAKTYEGFEDGVWNPPPGWLVSSIGGGGGGSTSSFAWSTAQTHGGTYSLGVSIIYPGAWSEGYVGFGSAYGSGGAGGPLDTRICGSAPTTLSVWIYSLESTTLHFGLWDQDGTQSYSNTFNPPTPFIPANTWTNVLEPLDSGRWDANLTNINPATITYVLIGLNDLTGAAHNSYFYIDDVQFLP